MTVNAGKRAKIRRLDDLAELFDTGSFSETPEGECIEDAESFERMLEDELGGIDSVELIRRKYPDAVSAYSGKRRDAHAGRVEAELDLHGFHAQEALVRLEAFIATSARQGLHTVRIIVGRGVHSQAGAVLPDAVEKKVVAMKRAGRIATFAWEKKSKRASGALIVCFESQ